MRPMNSSYKKSLKYIALFLSATAFLFMFLFSFAKAESNDTAATTETQLYLNTGTLNAGQSATFAYPYFPSPGESNDVNFSLAITGTNSSADLTIEGVGWGSATDGEIVWDNITLIPGTNNTFSLVNTGGVSLDYAFQLVTIATVPNTPDSYSWIGNADPSGENSLIQLDFPHSGLYTFDFTIDGDGSERFDFLLGTNYIKNTVTGNYSTTLFVEEGTQTLEIIQDTTAGDIIDWQVDISDAGQANDSLPYSKTNDDILEEWLPINLATDAKVNMVITANGDSNDSLSVTIDNATPQLTAVDAASISVLDGETIWATFDLPAGTSSIHLEADDDEMDYEFEIMTLPSADSSFAGYADVAGDNSKIRMIFGTSGLYDFDLGSNGRYQFLLNTSDNSYIQKTVEDSSNVTYYVPEGTHDLIIVQDTDSVAGDATWDVDISFNAASNDSLPYAKMGGEIGGADNDFLEEWLPISLSEAKTVNMVMEATGEIDDSFYVEVYNSGSSSNDYTLDAVLGTEEQWANFTLSAGMNRLKIVASQTGDPLDYDLTISEMQTASTTPIPWSGNVLDDGAQSTIIVNFPTTGLYNFNIESSEGFANLILDDNAAVNLLGLQASPPDLQNNYDIQVTAGEHEIIVVQDDTYAETTWQASVTQVSSSPEFFEFTGTLASGESVTPLYPGNMEYNFSLEVSGSGSDISLEIAGDPIWSGTALPGEIIWGTGTLSGNNELQLTNMGVNATEVTLTLYHIPDAGTTWDGFADMSGVNSNIRVNFPTDGLYTFDLNATSGRYQFLLDSEYIQKTVETGNTDDVTYFVPAGMHTLTIVQDDAVDTNWDIAISDVGASHDSLPYTKSGGDIGSDSNNFSTEWLPINLSAATEVNIATSITDASGDSVILNVRNASNTVLETVTVYGDETTWITLDLPAGTSLLEFDASSNTGANAQYEVMITTIPSAANYSWVGNSVATPSDENSHIRASFPTSGLYTFDFDAVTGRYQFLVNDEVIKKTVEVDDNGDIVYYVPEGTHDLYIHQDESTGADWNLNISGPGATNDTLPYTKSGGDIGGSGNQFSEEWLPIHVGADTLVNAVITIDGDSGDAVSLEVWDAVTRTETIELVYGTESAWATFTLPANGRLYLAAENGNTAPVTYDIEITEIPSPTFSWAGTSLAANPLNSTIQTEMQVSGVYHIQGVTSEGSTSILIDPAPVVNSPALVNSEINFQTHLDAGLHTFIIRQGTTGDGYVTSSWTYTVTLLSADAPEITSVTPAIVISGEQTTITIDGANFVDGAVVKLLGDSNYTLLTTFVNGNQLTAVVPSNVDLGGYDVQVINPDTKSDTLTDGLEVIKFYVFLPIITVDN